jgi:cysteine synthase
MDVIGAIGNTPLIELTRVGAGLPVKVYAKCEHLNPGGSVKDRAAKAIILDAEARGVIKPFQTPPMTLVEGTAGNTGVGLALVAAQRGYRLIVVMPERMAVDKRVMLAQLGAEVIITKNAGMSKPENFRNTAARLAEEHGWFLTNQFHNPANPQAHFETTGPEIIAQLAAAGVSKIGAFVSCSGTGGTISGIGRRMHAHDPAIQVVLADPIGSSLADWVTTGTLGPDGPYAVEGIGAATIAGNLHRDAIDGAEKVADAEAFAMVERLAKEEGLGVGGSAGVNVVAALRVAARGGLQGPVVTILCDTWDRYRSTAWMKAWAEREASKITLPVT